MEGIAQMDYKIIRLTDAPEIKEQAAKWFHDKWGIPLEAYQKSMEECLKKENRFPNGIWQWRKTG
jgi:predicted 3-demethylubiquinone-9 3-methyltransferase (glyoxalase superfamily)